MDESLPIEPNPESAKQELADEADEVDLAAAKNKILASWRYTDRLITGQEHEPPSDPEFLTQGNRVLTLFELKLIGSSTPAQGLANRHLTIATILGADPTLVGEKRKEYLTAGGLSFDLIHQDKMYHLFLPLLHPEQATKDDNIDWARVEVVDIQNDPPVEFSQEEQISLANEMLKEADNFYNQKYGAL